MKTCLHCLRPISDVVGIWWIDVTPPFFGGLYDFCVTSDGAHDPDDARR